MRRKACELDLCLDIVYHQAGVLLAVAALAPITNLVLVLEDSLLLGAAVRIDLGGHLRAGDMWSTGPYPAVNAGQQDIAQHDDIASRLVDPFNINRVARTHAILFAASSDYCVIRRHIQS